MALRLIAEDGDQRQHRQSLRRLLESTSGTVRIASAYVTDIDLLFGIKNRPVQLLTSLVRMDVVSGATSLNSLRALVEAGVQCCCLSDGPRLHAKVYLFGHELAVVTSANLTKSALDSNIEVGVSFTSENVKTLVAWFDSFWKTADRVDLADISRWEQDTEALRDEYSALRRKAGAKPTLPKEANPSVRSSRKLRDLVDNAHRFFVCNTNRRYSPDGKDENLMRQRQYATVWEDFRYPEHMKRVKPGDAIFMFAKGVGIIGIGRAKATHAVLKPNDPDRVRSDAGYKTEWRVPLEGWLAWVEHDEDAYHWSKMPHASFLDVSGANYGPLRTAVRKHFLREV